MEEKTKNEPGCLPDIAEGIYEIGTFIGIFLPTLAMMLVLTILMYVPNKLLSYYVEHQYEKTKNNRLYSWAKIRSGLFAPSLLFGPLMLSVLLQADYQTRNYFFIGSVILMGVIGIIYKDLEN